MACRFFLGISEAGFGPGIPYLLSFFYLRHEVYVFSESMFPLLDQMFYTETCLWSVYPVDMFQMLNKSPQRSITDIRVIIQRLTHRCFSVCRSFSNKFFGSVSLWASYSTSNVCFHVLIVEASPRGILIWQNGVYFSLSKASLRSVWRQSHTSFSQIPQTRRAFSQKTKRWVKDPCV